MADTFSVVEINPRDAERIKEHLEKVRAKQADTGDLYELIGTTTEEFNKFFLQYGKPYFTAHELKRNDTPNSRVYNRNVQSLDSDIDKLYSTLAAASRATLTAYNYATVVTEEVLNEAQAAASKVLDLNIVNNFIKGSVIVAGDDFINSDKIDTGVGVSTTRAEVLEGASAVSLLRVGAITRTGPNTKVSIVPVEPAGPNGAVLTTPTPSNLERFYEGQYYARMGEQQPEGGQLQLQYIVDPSKLSGTAVSTATNKQTQGQAEAVLEATKGIGFFAVIAASEEEKNQIRARMFDGDPSSFWQCEVVYAIPPLGDMTDDEEQGQEDESSAEGDQGSSTGKFFKNLFWLWKQKQT